MPKLIQDDQFVPRERIMLGSPEGAAGPGETMVNAAGDMQKMGRALREKGKQEIDEIAQIQASMAARAQAAARQQQEFNMRARASKANGIANNATSEAIKEYLVRYQERANQRLDKNGNPMFDTLHQDVGNIVSEITTKYGKLSDPLAAAQFKQNFDQFVTNRLPSVLEDVRRQQLDFSKASLARTVEAIQTTGGQDDIRNWQVYEGQLRTVLTRGIADGTISATDAVGMEQSVRAKIVGQGLNTLVFNDPHKALDILANNAAEDLGATAEQYNHAVQTAQVQALRLDEQDAKEREKNLKLQQAESLALTQAKVTGSLIRYESGDSTALQEAQYAVFTDQSLSESQRADMMNKIEKVAVSKRKEAAESSELMQRISNGESLAGVPSKAIESVYNNIVRTNEAAKGDRLTLQEKAFLIKPIRAAVPQFAKELESAALTGSREEAAQAVSAYKFITSEQGNPEVVNDMRSDAKAIMNMASLRMTDNLESADEAIKQARAAVLSMNDKDRASLEKTGFVDGQLKAGQIIDELGFNAAQLDTATSNRIARNYASNLVIHAGDEAAAKAATIQQVKQSYGFTQVTKAMEGDSIFTGSTAMYLPPEIAAKIDPSQPNEVEGLRMDLEDIVYHELPEGKTVDDVSYELLDMPASMTGLPANTRLYRLKIKDNDGVPVGLKDKNGQDIIWYVAPGVASDAWRRRQQLRDKQLRNQDITNMGIRG